MGYKFGFKAGTYVSPKESGQYPWPCDAEPERQITLFDDDILTKDPSTGRYMVHTGIGCFNIVLTDDQVVVGAEDVSLRML